ncbi:unnamed protein product, partial [Rotaria sp. Silwood1]
MNSNEIQHFSTDDINEIVFTHIFTMFSNLQYLNFRSSSICHEKLSIPTSL